jgi:hypothetical protein
LQNERTTLSETNDSVGKSENADNKSERKCNCAAVIQQIKSGLYNVFVPFTRITDVGFFTAVLALVAGLQWKTLDNTDRTLKETLIVTQRPWIRAEFAITSDFTFSDRGEGQISFAAILKNIGHSLANNIAMRAEVVLISQKTFGHVTDGQRAICDKLASRQLDITDIDLTLFPNDDGVQNLGLSVPKADIDVSTLPTEPRAGHRYFSPVLVGCVDYRFSFDSAHHQTMFAYEIARRLPNEPTHVGALYVGETNARADLGLVRWIFGGNDAN